MSKLETKFAVTAAIFATLAGVLGISSVVLLPKMAKNAADKAMHEGAGEQFNLLLAKAKVEEAQISQWSKDRTINVDGKCFRPRNLTRCYNKSTEGHITWVDSDKSTDCTGGWSPEGRMLVLAACDGQ